MRTVQIYSPKDTGFLGIEPQLNFPHPLGQEWKNMDTGLVALGPGDTVAWCGGLWPGWKLALILAKPKPLFAGTWLGSSCIGCGSPSSRPGSRRFKSSLRELAHIRAPRQKTSLPKRSGLKELKPNVLIYKDAIPSGLTKTVRIEW